MKKHTRKISKIHINLKRNRKRTIKRNSKGNHRTKSHTKEKTNHKQKGGDIIFSENKGRFDVIVNDNNINIIDTNTWICETFENNTDIIAICGFETINSDTNIFIFSITSHEDEDVEWIKEIINKIDNENIFEKLETYNIKSYIIKNTKSINMPNVDIYIDELNIELQLKCKKLKLQFGFKNQLSGEITQYEDTDDFPLLCLYYNEKCISSISLYYNYNNTNTIEILSRTHESYYNKKYNKLLRAITILICNKIYFCNSLIKQIMSHPNSPISAWTLKNEYSITHNLDKIKENNNRNLFNITDKDKFFKTFIKIEETYPLIININIKENLERAQQLFDNLVSSLPEKLPKSIICPEVIIP